MERGAHDAASRLRVAHVWSRPMDSTLSVSEQPIGCTSDGGAGQRHLRRTQIENVGFTWIETVQL